MSCIPSSLSTHRQLYLYIQIEGGGWDGFGEIISYIKALNCFPIVSEVFEMSHFSLETFQSMEKEYSRLDRLWNTFSYAHDQFYVSCYSTEWNVFHYQFQHISNTCCHERLIRIAVIQLAASKQGSLYFIKYKRLQKYQIWTSWQ